MKPAEYRYIAAWGRLMGSFAYYIDAEQQRAADANAPADAIYRDIDAGTWHRARDITNPETQYTFGNICDAMQIPRPAYTDAQE